MNGKVDPILFDQGVQFLFDQGLNLFASLPCVTLPLTIQTQLQQSGVPLANYSHLMFTGNGGRRFWQSLQDAKMETADPVDNFSTQLTTEFITQYLDNPPHLLLYPLTDYLVPLTQLGELAGWSHPSPLGQGIHAQFGVWFAYRTAFLVNGRFPTITHAPTKSPCQSCVAKPCISACPSGAVQATHFDIFTCADFRVSHNSVCADRCLARMACPVAPEHRYTLPQIQYHYSQSLITIRTYQNHD